ncbi:MAG: AIM24 family protein [Thermoplasmata archaeon]|nr:AIM24 family protein [Thermoplasmata archaeon]MCI4362423.1 AIM24 family protein [Thermoplasmata archaeon]
MAKFDHVGDVSPALLVQLAPREQVMVLVDSVRYRDPGITVGRVKYEYPNPTGRMPKTLWHYFETLDGPGTATVSTGVVGEIRFGQLAAGESLFLHSGALIAHEATMKYDRVTLASYEQPRVPFTQYLTAARLTGPGKFAFQTHGNALSFNLRPGESVRTERHALLTVTPGATIGVKVFGGAPHFPPMHYFPLVDVTGPGTVLVHSGRYLLGA